MRTVLPASHFFAIALCGLFIVSARAQGDDLDRQLAKRPGQTITADEAAQRTKELRALADAHPEQRDQIEAFLIPYLHIAEPAPAAPAADTSTPAPETAPAPAPHTMYLIRGTDGVVTAIRAQSAQRQGPMLVLTEENGGRAVVQTRTVAGQLPWYSEEELQSGAVDLLALAIRYETAARALPSLRKSLEKDAAHFREIVVAKKKSAQEQELAARAHVEQATAARYDVNAGYTVDALAKLLLAAEQVRKAEPSAAQRIDEWAAPFQDHFYRLLAGETYENGGWVTADERARRTQAAREKAFRDSLAYEIPGASGFSAAMRDALAKPVLFAVGALLAGVALLVFSGRRLSLQSAGIVLLGIAPAIPATVFFLATRDPGRMPAPFPASDPKPVLGALAQIAGTAPAAAVEISQAALNTFLAESVRIRPGKSGADGLREALTATWSSEQIDIFETVRAGRFVCVIRYALDVHFEDGKFTAALAGVSLGRVSLPEAAGRKLWSDLEAQLDAVLAATHLVEHFAVSIPAAGVLSLRPVESSDAAPATP